MKFTDGYWLVREGFTVRHPSQAYRVETTDDSLIVLAAIAPQTSRAGILNSPAITVTCTAPIPDVIRVQAVHHSGRRDRGPHFELPGLTHKGRAHKPKIAADARKASLTSGHLSLRIDVGARWQMEFSAGGKTLTASGEKALGFAEADGRHFMKEELSLGVGERVYGLGERFGTFVKNGQSIDIENKDGGTGSDQAYKNVPFYLTDRGYGVFVNDPGVVGFEVASEKVGRVGFSVESQSLDYFVVYGPTPKEILEKYTALTGRPALPPAWSFGLWLSTSFTTDYDEKTIGAFVDGMVEREIPLSVFHFDTFWMRGAEWCNFTWDPDTFPDPPGMLRRLHQRDLRVCVWINPYVAQASPLFAEAVAAGYMLKRPNGDVWQTDLWTPGMGIVDFTNPGARTWYAGKLAALLDQGVDCFKTDFGERIPTDVVWHDGSDPAGMHNYYTYLYNKTVFDLLREKRGEGEAVVFARSATAGCQRFPVHWGGDCESTATSMAETLRGGLSLGLSGFGFWSHDIGGFEGSPSPVLYQRWAAFGLLSSHSRLHGSTSYRVPWLIEGDKSVDVVAQFARLKCRLMPYLYGVAAEAAGHGIPMLRAMLLEFADDPTAGYLDRQYMLGPSILVAPVFTESGQVDFYVPAGKWTHLVSGHTVSGPRWHHGRYDVLSLPVLVRPGAVIPIGAHSDRPDYDFADGVTLQAYELVDGAKVRVEVPDQSGRSDAVFEVSRNSTTVTAERVRGAKPWRLLLFGVRGARALSGGDAVQTADGTLVTPNQGASRLEVSLS